MTNPQTQSNAMEPDVLNEVCAKADAARIAQAQLAQTNTQRKTNFSTPSLTHSTRAPMKSRKPTPSTCRNPPNMAWTQANSTGSNLTYPASTQPHKVCAT